MTEKFQSGPGPKMKEKEENEAVEKPSMLQRLVGKAKAAARVLTEESRALVPLEVEPQGMKAPEIPLNLGILWPPLETILRNF